MTTPDVPLEAGEGDALEQATSVAPDGGRVDRDLPLEAPEADAVEQAQELPDDDDERRG